MHYAAEDVQYHLNIVNGSLGRYMGKVIGKQGRIAKAIRSVVKAASTRDHTHVDVEIA